MCWASVAELQGRTVSRPAERVGSDIISLVRFLRMKPGHGEVLIAEGDVDAPEQERLLIEEFRRQLDAGLWAAVPGERSDGQREARMVRDFDEIPRDADRVIFFPRAAGGR
jgi:molybdopterin converting factor small subunit